MGNFLGSSRGYLAASRIDNCRKSNQPPRQTATVWKNRVLPHQRFTIPAACLDSLPARVWPPLWPPVTTRWRRVHSFLARPLLAKGRVLGGLRPPFPRVPP